ncbi:LacI family transcriptional regulator [Ruminococcaceae bacterium OttesenSCG-928-L11]|nr:LacI family transcriptional regulator [Ruminococcaceae bacterium OttesenSCG-928-L11]
MSVKHGITSKDVARVCGVSQATVSYVINNKSGKRISAETKELVLETAQRLGYHPNSAARGMRTSLSQSIGIIMGRPEDNGFNDILRSIHKVVREMDFTLTLLPSHRIIEDETDTAESMAFYSANRVDGLLFAFCEMGTKAVEILNESGIPYVVLNAHGVWTKTQPEYQYIARAINQSAELCLANRSERILLFNYERRKKTSSRKFDLFEASVSSIYPEAVFERCSILAEGRDESEQLADISARLEQGGDYDLVVSATQRLGFLVQYAIMRRRFALPQRPRHICLDDLHAAQEIYPTITCIDIPLAEMGAYAAHQLLRTIKGLPFEEKRFDGALKVGNSTE